MRFDGTAGADYMREDSLGHDQIYGYGGNDTIYARYGDNVYGGAGDDVVYASPRSSSGAAWFDLIYGGSGNDSIYMELSSGGRAFGDAGNDLLRGSGFRDELHGGLGNDTLEGGASDDRLYLDGGGTDRAEGGEGDDHFYVSAGRGWILGGAGRNQVDFYQAPRSITLDLADQTRNTGLAAKFVLSDITDVAGTFSTDRLYGDAASNMLVGYDGNDLLAGRGGVDYLNGQHGNDMLNGGLGADDYYGGYGRDTVSFATARTGIIADLRSDHQNTGLNSGEAAGDQYYEMENMLGSRFADVLRGDAIYNELNGARGNDLLIGRSGGDRLSGDNGRDRLLGGDGRDRLSGGQGNDQLNGGAGADIFVFREGDDRDTISDFRNNVDTVRVTGLGLDSFAEARSHVRQAGDHVVFDFDDGDVLVVQNTTIAQLANDMTFG